MKLTFFLFLISFSLFVFSQDYKAEISDFREKYKNDFLTDPNSPLKKEDLPYLQFYEPNKSFKVNATFRATKNAEPFDLPTYSGKLKKYIKYGDLTFLLKGETISLEVYQSLTLKEKSEYKDHLFLPFKDATNNISTYGGGRYIDLKTSDIKKNQIEIDFNKCYNPYCAYSDGYACPVPPAANHLKARVEAGEKKFGKEH